MLDSEKRQIEILRRPPEKSLVTVSIQTANAIADHYADLVAIADAAAEYRQLNNTVMSQWVGSHNQLIVARNEAANKLAEALQKRGGTCEGLDND